MARKLFPLAAVLAVVLAISGYLWFFGKPGEKTTSPFTSSSIDSIERIQLENPNGKAELQKTDHGWELTTPVHDAADSDVIEQMLAALGKFSLSDAISENASKHEQFRVDAAHGQHLRVFLKGQTTPVLDGIIGKSAEGYDNSYFRMERSTPVYVAKGISEYLFVREPKSFRALRVLSFEPSEAVWLSISQDKSTFEMKRSSHTWTNAAGKTFDAAAVAPLLSKLAALRVAEFGAGLELDSITGFSQPSTKFTVTTASGTVSVMIGKNAAKGVGPVDMRYAKTDGRDAVLLLRSDNIDDILSSIKTFR